MQLAEELKRKGNTSFADGDVEGAVTAYLQAIEVITREEKDDSGAFIDGARELLAVLHSNLSNVYLIQGRYDNSWEAAQESTRHDPSFAKAWLRYVHARRLAGYPFEAFVALLRYLRPLLRRQAMSSSSVAEIRVSEVEAPLCRDLGLSDVSSHIELQDYKGGVGIVARKMIKPNDVILVEKRFETSFAEMDLGTQADLTTVKIVTYFAKKIFPEQQTRSEKWMRYNKEFKGCWPRSLEDITSEARGEIAHALRVHFPEMNDKDFEELLSFAVMCRYNCFHSGFFRACALANHSCHANAAMKFCPESETVTLIAVRTIEAGEFVNVKYLSDAHFLMGLGRRRECLRSWLFWCECDRCCSDSKSTATQEQVQCRECQHYTHLPLPSSDTDTGEEDPLTPQEKPCTHCGAIVTWSPESRAAVTRLMLAFGQVSMCAPCQQLTSWLVANLRQIAELHVHPDHWMYRVLLYFFCVPMTSIVNKNFELFSKVGWQESQVELLLRDFGVRRTYADAITSSRTIGGRDGDGEDRGAGGESAMEENMGGGDVLYALSVLWRLISPFYPEYEGWALHRAICQLVLFSHIHPSETLAMSASHVLLLLRRHGKYIGDADASLWLQAYNQHKPTGHRKGLLNAKQLKGAFRP
ncbi:hypothetical protein DQ04_02581070 [Trypanosoma grayi]|uniref:hypothetical protein n=1 Tax=Trypanosoma grayi TaxID=71804 RepID=UPI0004F42C80|nr:hypothetical protein DQ04_02581070 [Trypanosoma grayi]KEG11479.1 hypothetical protein DQ04_02581070 [Trypanosoma grayi]